MKKTIRSRQGQNTVKAVSAFKDIKFFSENEITPTFFIYLFFPFCLIFAV